MVRQERSISGAIRLHRRERAPVEALHRDARCQAGIADRFRNHGRERVGIGYVCAGLRLDLGFDVEADMIGAAAFDQIEHLGQRRNANIVGAALIAKACRIGAVGTNAADIVALQLGEGQRADGGRLDLR